ncbi:MAG: protein tyrosine phosphatase family protein [Janthinobacterium lividum]
MADPTSIYHWQRLDERITTSGQPTEMEFAELGRLGVRKIVNLALIDSPRALPDEAATVNALGMEYIHIPVNFAAPTEADFDSFCAAMAAAESMKVHVHCVANYRVSAFFCRYRRDVLGIDPAQARADLERLWQPDAVWTAFIERISGA